MVGWATSVGSVNRLSVEGVSRGAEETEKPYSLGYLLFSLLRPVSNWTLAIRRKLQATETLYFL